LISVSLKIKQVIISTNGGLNQLLVAPIGLFFATKEKRAPNNN
jgi:hypothetical protein